MHCRCGKRWTPSIFDVSGPSKVLRGRSKWQFSLTWSSILLVLMNALTFSCNQVCHTDDSGRTDGRTLGRWLLGLQWLGRTVASVMKLLGGKTLVSAWTSARPWGRALTSAQTQARPRSCDHASARTPPRSPYADGLIHPCGRTVDAQKKNVRFSVFNPQDPRDPRDPRALRASRARYVY
jgi:hypothetical protein